MRSPLARLAELFIVLCLALGIAWIAHTLWQPIRVGGWSMHPALHVGDLVAVSLRERGSAIGDVVLIEQPGRQPVLHRVIEVMGDGAVRTKGDANPVPDREPTPASQIRGRVMALLPLGELVERWRGEPVYATMTTQSNSTQH
jgi:signal peptidase I